MLVHSQAKELVLVGLTAAYARRAISSDQQISTIPNFEMRATVLFKKSIASMNIQGLRLELGNANN